MILNFEQWQQEKQRFASRVNQLVETPWLLQMGQQPTNQLAELTHCSQATRPMIIGPALTESCLPRTNISHMKVVLQLDHLRFINVRYEWVSRNKAEQHVSEIKLKLQTQSSGVRLWKLYSMRGFIKSCMNMCVLSALSGQSSAVAHLSASLSRR